MFEALKTQPEDQILRLMGLFRDDPRPDKIDLGVGVYKDAAGNTPIMRAVKAAEKRLWETETTKTYTGLAGDPGFQKAMAALILGSLAESTPWAGAATPGGTGAVRQAFEMVRMTWPDATVWVSDPTWPNHLSILAHLGLKVRHYRYFDAETRGLDMPGLLADLGEAKPGDVVLLHGCCHNPTGANPALPDWQAIADLIVARGLFAVVDLAYQGFGDGIEEDAAATRLLVQRLPEMLIAASCSKNFGIYRERTGILIAVSRDEATRQRTAGTLAYLNRQNFSFPPDHGARLVTMILTDPALRADWETELSEMRASMLALRHKLAEELQRLTQSDRFGFIAGHRGMFSRLGATPEQVARLREDHGIYIIGDSRMNIAGLSDERIPVLARAIVATGI